MRIVAAIVGVIVIALMLSEFFVTFMLPRRVRRDPRIARGFLRALWGPWRAFARQLSPSSADTVLGFFGRVGLDDGARDRALRGCNRDRRPLHRDRLPARGVRLLLAPRDRRLAACDARRIASRCRGHP